MKIEFRADGAHISGYVNATEKKSKPVITPRGTVIEEIEAGAFQRAIDRAGNITLNVDHNSSRVYADTKSGTLQLFEDAIGLHADVLITDEELIAKARKGKIKGWSFGMVNVVDEMLEFSGEYPLRKVKRLDLDHVTLVINKTPVYPATSVELRDPEEFYIVQKKAELAKEARSLKRRIAALNEGKKPSADLAAEAKSYRARANALKK